MYCEKNVMLGNISVYNVLEIKDTCSLDKNIFAAEGIS